MNPPLEKLCYLCLDVILALLTDPQAESYLKVCLWLRIFLAPQPVLSEAKAMACYRRQSETLPVSWRTCSTGLQLTVSNDTRKTESTLNALQTKESNSLTICVQAHFKAQSPQTHNHALVTLCMFCHNITRFAISLALQNLSSCIESLQGSSLTIKICLVQLPIEIEDGGPYTHVLHNPGSIIRQGIWHSTEDTILERLKVKRVQVSREHGFAMA